ncbi:MAG TPA: DUF2062 domain-containing protein [Verrucomicrobiae bacterium]|jgi:hypothetical protein
MNVHRWLREHSLKLLAIRDTPEAIAGGVAIGIFFGFTPLFGLKTICAIFFAWLTRSNIIAAVLAGTLHDIVLPLMPFIWRLEYSLGYWLLNQEWPRHLSRGVLHAHPPRNWTTFLTVGRPWLLGSVLLGAPISLISYFITKLIVARHHRKHPHPPPVEEEVEP